MRTWQFISESISAGLKTMLIFVVDSQGSSPGRKGFCMGVSESGEFTGTIGGGIMEVKLIELAKHKLANNQVEGIIKLQFHDKTKSKNRSGLICSGRQIVALVSVDQSDQQLIEKLKVARNDIDISISENGLAESVEEDFQESITINHEQSFECLIRVKHISNIHIFGAGHVGVALSNQMNLLGFRVNLFDNRDDLNTIKNLSKDICFKRINYSDVLESITITQTDYAVIASYSYSDDKVLIKELWNLPFAYIGMMGSDAKITQLKKELAQEGITEEDIQHVDTPIGINIYSKTAEEIAVSIAAKIILSKNITLPTGRDYSQI